MPAPTDPIKHALWRARLSAANRGKRHSPETKAKIAAGNVGKHNILRPDVAGDKNPMRRPEVVAKHRKDEPKYNTAHRRVDKERGKATLHICMCGASATQWALRHGRGKTQRGKGGHVIDPTNPNLRVWNGMLYSLNTADYVPLCEPCHRKHDYGLLG